MGGDRELEENNVEAEMSGRQQGVSLMRTFLLLLLKVTDFNQTSFNKKQNLL